MPKIKFYVISCSSDAPDCDVSKYYIHIGGLHFGTGRKIEAKKMLKRCQALCSCDDCNGALHECFIERYKKED